MGVLKAVWSGGILSIKGKVEVLISCIFSRLLYAAERALCVAEAGK